MQEPRPFFERVQSVRGIGAFFVAAWHLAGWGPAGISLLPAQPWPAVSAVQQAIGRFELALLPGHAALMVFFTISGFVLRISLQYGAQEFDKAAARFLFARFFRIYPVSMFAILVAAMAHNWQVPATLDHPASALNLTTFINNLLLVDVSLNTTLWAIQLEVVMAPFIVLLYFVERRYGPWALLWLGVIASGLSFDKHWAIWPPLSANFFSFVFGMTIPTLGRSYVQQMSRLAAQRLLLATVICLFVTGQLLGFFSRFSALIEGYAAVPLLAIVAYRPDVWGLRWLDLKPLRLLGLASGSFYVLHMSVFVWIMEFLRPAIPQHLSFLYPALVGPAVIIACLTLFAPIAVLSYYLVEAPAIAFGRQLIKRRRYAPAEPATGE